MKTPANSELSALAAVSGPQLTRAEIETKKLLADMEAASKAVDAVPLEMRRERVAAVLAGIVSLADAEAVRAAYWTRTPLPARRVACMAAGYSKDRANDALTKFNAFERTRIWTALDNLIGDLQQIQKCMNGGAVPAAEAVH